MSFLPEIFPADPTAPEHIEYRRCRPAPGPLTGALRDLRFRIGRRHAT